jgi:hypothetical protein
MWRRWRIVIERQSEAEALGISAELEGVSRDLPDLLRRHDPDRPDAEFSMTQVR